MRLLITVTFLTFATLLPALAQAPSTSGEGQPPAPTAPNSGAGIPGQPGNKSGPAAGSAEALSSDQQKARNQDTSNIPGQPGGKSGPAVAPPSSSSSK
jgi:hypothetical protein